MHAYLPQPEDLVSGSSSQLYRQCTQSRYADLQQRQMCLVDRLWGPTSLPHSSNLSNMEKHTPFQPASSIHPLRNCVCACRHVCVLCVSVCECSTLVKLHKKQNIFPLIFIITSHQRYTFNHPSQHKTSGIY